jgi:hypothetical protein
MRMAGLHVCQAEPFDDQRQEEADTERYRREAIGG